MAYEKEAISSPATPAVAVTPSITREERVLEPYRSRTPVAKSAQPTAPIGQGNTTEKPTAEAVALSPQMTALLRREQKFRQEQAALKAEKERLEAEKAEIVDLRTVKAKLAAKDYSALDSIVDYNEYAQFQLDRLNGTDPTKEAIKSLSSEIENLKKSQEENTSKLFEAAVAERRNAVKSLVETKPEYSALKKMNLQEAVVQHILDTWEHDSIELSPEEAAKEVQAEVLDRAKKMAAILEIEQASQGDQPAAEKKPLPAMKPGLRTITNQVTAGEITQRKSLYGLSDQERWAEARRRAEAKLQKQTA